MLDELKKHAFSIKILITLSIAALGIHLFQLVWSILGNFSDVFIILICSWLLSFILEPLVLGLNRITKIPKVASALVVYICFFGVMGVIFFLFIPIVYAQLQGLFTVLPKYLSGYPSFVNKWGEILTNSLDSSIFIIPSVAQFIFNTVLIFIISFYFVLDKTRINQEFIALIPKKWHKEIEFIEEVIDSSFASFIRVQLLFGLMAGVATWIVLRIFNVDFALSTSFVAGVLTIVPFLGPFLGIIPPVIISFVTDPGRGLFVFIVLLIAQQIIFNVIGPKLLGKALKMHPIVVLLSFIVGYKIAGGIGAVFAIPVLGTIILVAHRIGKHFLHFEQ